MMINKVQNRNSTQVCEKEIKESKLTQEQWLQSCAIFSGVSVFSSSKQTIIRNPLLLVLMMSAFPLISFNVVSAIGLAGPHQQTQTPANKSTNMKRGQTKCASGLFSVCWAKGERQSHFDTGKRVAAKLHCWQSTELAKRRSAGFETDTIATGSSEIELK